MITGTYIIVPDFYGKISQTASLILECDTTDAPVNIQLPEISALHQYSAVKIIIFDATGNASVNNITVTSFGSEKLGSDGVEVINVNGAGIAISAVNMTEWLAVATAELGGGSGGGGIQSVVAGTNVSVDNTDPENPIINVPILTRFQTIVGQGRTIADGSGTVTVPCLFMPKLALINASSGLGNSTGNSNGSNSFADEGNTTAYWSSSSAKLIVSGQQAFVCEEAGGIWQGQVNNFTPTSFDIVYEKIGNPTGNINLYIKIQG